MNIVPWSSPEEWLHVYHCLRDNQLDDALVLISGWKRRMGSDSPTGILATHAILVGLEAIREKGESPETIFCAAGCLTQAIGLMVERLRFVFGIDYLINYEITYNQMRHRLDS